MHQNMAKLLIHILAIVLALLASSAHGANPYKALVARINQTDTIFTITLNLKERLVIDIESPLSWHHCPKPSPSVPCRASQCLAAQINAPPCKPSRPPPKSPFCRSCSTLPYNPITKSCEITRLSYTNVSISSTDGRNPLGDVKYNKIYMSCASRPFIHTLPKGTHGLASLSKGSLSLVSQLSNSKVVKKFGMCLSDQGVAFFGDGPFNFLPPPPLGRDVTQFLGYTPLIKNPLDNIGYYIALNNIAINQQSINTPLTKGLIKLSTITRYSALASNIYMDFVSQFAKATSGIPRVPKVAPFDYCINTTNVGSTRVGLGVPQIDLQLGNGANWTIFGANSIIQTSNDVGCLAFVNGGKGAKQAMVIGSFQMEDNFVQFDLVNSRLGFSSILYFYQTTCSNFNFTSGVN